MNSRAPETTPRTTKSRRGAGREGASGAVVAVAGASGATAATGGSDVARGGDAARSNARYVTAEAVTSTTTATIASFVFRVMARAPKAKGRRGSAKARRAAL